MSQTISQDRGVISLIRDAVRGEAHYDFTQERIGRAIALLSIPMVLEMMMESLFAVVDMFWVAHLGADAVATVGLTEAVLTILFTIAMGLSIATTAMVARRIGEKNPKEAAEVAVQALLLGVIVAGVVGIAGAWFAEDVLRLMGASVSIVAISLVAVLVRAIGSRTSVLKSVALTILPGRKAPTVVSLALGLVSRSVGKRLWGVRRSARLRLKSLLRLRVSGLPLGGRSETIRQRVKIAVIL